MWVSFWSILLFSVLNRFGLFRVPKEIEIMGLDIAEMGGVNEDVYSKLRTDFGVVSPTLSPQHSQLQPQRTQRLLSLDKFAKDKLDRFAEEQQQQQQEELLPKFGHKKDE